MDIKIKEKVWNNKNRKRKEYNGQVNADYEV